MRDFFAEGMQMHPEACKLANSKFAYHMKKEV